MSERIVIRLTLALVLSTQVWAANGTWQTFSVRRQDAAQFSVTVTMDTGDSPDDSNYACQRLIAVPAGTLPEIEVVRAESAVYRDDAIAAGAGSLPLVSLGEPVQCRGLRLVPVVVRHIRRDPSAAQTVVCTRTEFRVTLPPGQIGVVPPGIAQMLGSTVLAGDYGLSEAPEGYFIIVPDAFYDNILPLALWKAQKGFAVTVKRKSEVGSTSEQIRTYIANAYHSWPVPPEYVLLAGNVDQIPTFTTPRVGTASDQIYGCIDGDDFFPEVLVGRLPANTAPMLDYLVQKIFNYERTPFVDDTNWYRRAMMIATIYQEGGTPTVTALETKRWVRSLLLGRGFSEVDTVFDPPYHGSGVAPVDSSVDRGVCFINGRGWGNSGGWNYPPFRTSDIQGLNNGWKQPVITSLYCGTAAIQQGATCFGEAWLQAGSPSQPRGAVAFFGPSWLSTSTRWNNCLDYGIYHGIFNEGITSLAPAMYRGKLEIFENFPMPTDTYYLRAYFYVYNVLGDPSLELWTGSAPRALNAAYPTRVAVGTSRLAVSVTDAHALPLSGALVTLTKGLAVQSKALTRGNGQVFLAIPPVGPGETLHVTVTKHGSLPHLGSVLTEDRGVFVGYNNASSGTVLPGTTIPVTVELKNFGTGQSASSVTARLRSSDNYVTVIDSVMNYGTIAPGESLTGTPFQFQLASACSSGHLVSFALFVSSGDSGWMSGFDLTAADGRLVFRRNAGMLAPGQVSDIIVTLLNKGARAVTNLTGTLRSASNAAVVEDSWGAFGDANPGDSVGNTADAFRVRIKPDVAVGRSLGFDVLLLGSGFQQNVHFDLVVGPIGPGAPMGPDAYGYYAYDEVDAAYSEHPTYGWVEIDPNQGGAGTRLELANDDTKVVGLPFFFRYYGRDYGRISICDNGFLACDSTNEHSIYNWRIPSAYGPPNIIAPFWDDFRTDTMGASGVYSYYDDANHRFVVEWSRVVHVHGFKPPVPSEQQTFEAVLYDPAYHPTRTGDGEILFQYQTVFNDDSFSNNCHNRATVGLGNQEKTTGLQCTFADSLSPACAPFGTGRAVKFTTDRPDTFTGIGDAGSREVGWQPVLEVEPNPASRAFALRWWVPNNCPGTIRMMDVSGRTIRTWNASQGSGMIHLTGVPNGTYFVNLTVRDKGHILTAKRKLVIVDLR